MTDRPGPIQWVRWSVEVLIVVVATTTVLNFLFIGGMPRSVGMVVSTVVVTLTAWAFIAIRHTPTGGANDTMDDPERTPTNPGSIAPAIRETPESEQGSSS